MARSLRVDAMLAFQLPEGSNMDPGLAVDELSALVKAKFLQFTNAISAVRVHASALGPLEPVKASMHVCMHSFDGCESCGPVAEIE